MGVKHDPSICPMNYEGLSKEMKTAGSSRLTTNISDRGKVVIGTHVGNEDSTFRMVMRHSFQEIVDAGKMESAAWP
jgi:hypothetical protein